ncbi:hypothetical protein AXF42_Ash007486 [Apostasia shenzhenica]|uniref:DUF599 domain-containing protein n=1 Tax=Apostasia shenzhenica TaxID=1088818 RepID=A0A2I0A5L2_9ASPA|nr:hypothetical protein AXF42_Ash007486 [Apostasia shenzhenica]
MMWRKSDLDLILVPFSLLLSILYHAWLWRKLRAHPHLTDIGTSSAIRRQWVISIMKENNKRNILAVQTIRNSIMGATLMASTSILLCTGLAAILSSTYSVKQPVGDAVYGAHGPLMLALKYAIILVFFLFAFFAYSLSIHFFNQVSFIVNVVGDGESSIAVTPEYVSEQLEKGFMLGIVGNRILYTGLLHLLWMFGPVLVFLCSIVMVPVLYSFDINVGGEEEIRVRVCGKEEQDGGKDIV